MSYPSFCIFVKICISDTLFCKLTNNFLLHVFIFRKICAKALLDIADGLSNITETKKASLSVLFLPLWLIVSETAPVPFEIPNDIEKVKHNFYTGVWWGLTEEKLRNLDSKLKRNFNGLDEYALY